MRVCLRLVPATLVLLVLATVARSADLLDAVPSTALGLAVINRLEATSDKVEKVAGLIHAPAVSLLTLARVQTGMHDGLDTAGTLGIAIFPARTPGAPPTAAIFVPVTDYKKFLTQLQPDNAADAIASVRLVGRPTLICQKGNFAVLADADSKTVLEDVLNSVKDLSGELSPLRTWLGEVDAAVVGTEAGLKLATEMLEMQIGQTKAQMQAMAQQQPAAAQQVQSVVAIYEAFGQLVKTFPTEVSNVAAGLRVDDDTNLRLTLRSRFVPSGSWASLSKGFKANKDDLLAGLPADSYAMVFGGVIPKSWRELMAGAFGGMMKANPVFAQMTADQQEKLVKAMTGMMAPVESMAMTMGAPPANEPLYAGLFGILRVNDSKQYLAGYGDAVKAMNEAFKLPGQQGDMYELTSTTVDGQEVLDLTTNMGAIIPANAPNAAEMKKMFEKMFGTGDKMHAYIAAVDDKTLVNAYVSTNSLKRALAAAKKPGEGLSGNADLQATAKLMPSGPQWVGYLHAGGAVNWFAQIMAISMPPGFPAPQLPKLPDAPPIGLAGKLTGTGFNGDLIVPKGTLTAIADYVQTMRGGR